MIRKRRPSLRFLERCCNFTRGKICNFRHTLSQLKPRVSTRWKKETNYPLCLSLSSPSREKYFKARKDKSVERKERWKIRLISEITSQFREASTFGQRRRYTCIKRVTHRGGGGGTCAGKVVEQRLVNVDEFTTKLHRRRSERGTPYYCDYV